MGKYPFYFERIGSKAPNIVILPGWGNQRKTFSYLIRYFSQFASVYILDYPGFGKSNWQGKDYTIYDYAWMIKDWLEQEDIVDPIIIGHSFGGRILVLLLSYYHLAIKKAILIDSAGILPSKTKKESWKRKEYRILKKCTSLIPQKWKKRYQEWLIQKFGSNDYKSLPSSMRKTFINIVTEDLEPYLEKIEQEVLLIWGKQDTVTPLSDAFCFKEKIRESGLVVIDGAGHFPYLDHPEYICRIIFSYIKNDL